MTERAVETETMAVESDDLTKELGAFDRDNGMETLIS